MLCKCKSSLGRKGAKEQGSKGEAQEEEKAQEAEGSKGAKGKLNCGAAALREKYIWRTQNLV